MEVVRSLEVKSIWMVFKAMQLDEITQEEISERRERGVHISTMGDFQIQKEKEIQ